MLQVAVGRDEDFEFRLGHREQLAVGQRRPAQLEGSLHFVAAQVVAQRGGNALIEKNAH